MKTEIVYEDRDILVCRKPAGFAVQSARASQMDMESELRNYLCGGGLHVLHRLDQPVEGLLVFAKSRDAAAKLEAQMRDQTMRKYYRALACGRMPQTEGELIDEIVKTGNGVAEIVTAESGTAQERNGAAEIAAGSAENGSRKAAGADLSDLSTRRAAESGTTQKRQQGGVNASSKRAALSYQVVSYDADIGVTDVKICLHTGRFHQIRLQFSHAGHPLVGDRKYGDETAWALAETLGLSHVALCAERLCFLHPRTGKEMDFCITPTFHKK
ncbi:MAG: RluA family pseudouridine synthase [Clostridium sp.]|nr:RluA family pseudouridine synthase [Clostridium sp.]